MSRIVFTNGSVFDSVAGNISANQNVIINGERIEGITTEAVSDENAKVFDIKGKTLMPGLIDAHIHVTSTVGDFAQTARMPQSLITAESMVVLSGIIDRGFTSVRDAAGADFGLALAVDRDLFRGPRLYYSGSALSQTGGHGDLRERGQSNFIQCPCCHFVGLLGRIADGVAEVRRAARDELRKGATQVKIMASGGVATPTDPIHFTQYSIEELKAVVEEAEAAGTYVMAHAYTGKAIIRAVECGIRTIEHGNLIDAAAARSMAGHSAYLVPTLAIYEALHVRGKQQGVPEVSMQKLDVVRSGGVKAIKLAKEAGVKIGFGTDLMGGLHDQQSNEFSLRSEVMSNAEMLRSATRINAEMMLRENEIGTIAPSAYADLLVVDGDPTEDIGLLQNDGAHLSVIMKAGRFYKNRFCEKLA